MAERRIEHHRMDDIVPADRNPRNHNLPGIRALILRFGFTAPVLRDERTGRLVAGHGRVLALSDLRNDGQLAQLINRHRSGEHVDIPPGITITPDGDWAPNGVGIDHDGGWLVPIVCGWESKSDAEASAYLIADNRQTELARWDNDGLLELLDAIGEDDADLVGVAGFTDADTAALRALTEDDPDEPPAARTDPDDVPGLAAQVHSERGDLWVLGGHRLLCGDSTNPDDVDRVLEGLGEPGIVYTDPPYGISIVNDSGKVGHRRGMPFRGLKGDGKIIPTTEYLPVAGDDSTETAAEVFRLMAATFPAAMHVWWGGNHYAGAAGLPDSPCWLVWDKENNGHFADAELAWTNHDGAVRLLRHMWNGMVRASERGKRVHPNQKPVALAEWAFEQVDPKKERGGVLDLFAGSGSTLIAAHRTRRWAALVEMEPAYVDVICRRWQEHTGILPERVLDDGTTQPRDFTLAE